MFLKFFSTSELDFHTAYKNGFNKFKKLSQFDKYMTFFWLLGPFIYLIERSPADIWLSLIGVIFLLRCVKKKQWQWTSQLWFKLSVILWIMSLLSALLSPDRLFSFSQGIVWIRFPLYAAAAQVWLGKDRDIRIMMLISIVFGMILMCVILTCEIIIEPKTRLTWPYLDLVPGGYLAKVSLPVFCCLIAVTMRNFNLKGLIIGFIALLTILIAFLTGERMNFIIRLGAAAMSSVFWKPKLNLLIFAFFLSVAAIPTTLNYIGTNGLVKKYTIDTYKEIPILNMKDTNPYWGSWRGGIQQAWKTPLTGIGPSGTRKTCAKLKQNEPNWLPGKNYCGNHPHNFYIQLLAETGIMGFILGSLIFFNIIKTCYKARTNHYNCPMAATAFITPFVLFFPLQQFGSFFGQWGNLFIWFAIGFALSQFQGYKKN